MTGLPPVVNVFLQKFLMDKVYFRGRVFLYLVFGFFLSVVIGTYTHELGHYIVAKIYGYTAIIEFNYTYLLDEEIDNIDRFYITIGGPVQTITFGTLGISLLYFKRKSFQGKEKLSFVQWSLIFLSLFWLRQIINSCTSILGYFLNGELSQSGDEVRIAKFYGLPEWSVLFFSGLIGLAVSLWVFFKFIPKPHRFMFLLSAIVGGGTGYLLWIILL